MEELNSLYQEMMDQVLGISGFDWEQIVVRFTKDEMHSGIMVYYKIKGQYRTDDELINENCLDESDFDTTLFNLADSIKKVKRVTQQKELQEWNNMIFIIKKEFKIMNNILGWIVIVLAGGFSLALCLYIDIMLLSCCICIT